MALSAPRRCRTCRQLVRGKCETCDAAWIRKPQSWSGGGTRRWRAVRAQRLAVEPLCRFCGALADTVDHIDGTDYESQRYDLDMTRSLCASCHATRTAAQGNLRFRKRRTEAVVTLVCGPPCGGKSRYVREHAKPGDLIVDLDLLMRALTGLPMHEHVEAVKPLAFDARDAVLERLWSGSHDVRQAWIVTTAATEKQRATYVRRGCRVVMVTASPEELRRRCAKRPALWLELVERWLAEHDVEGIHETVVTG